MDGDAAVGPYNAALAEVVAAHERVALIDPTPIACPDGVCAAFDDEGVVVHRDDNHLSATFVRRHAAAFGALLASTGAHV